MKDSSKIEDKNIFLIIDEVYNFKNKLPKKFLEYENVIIIRSFSKTFGLPELRLGYGIANKELIKLQRMNTQAAEYSFSVI